MATKAQEHVDAACVAAKAGNDTAAAGHWQNAAREKFQEGDKKNALVLAICCVSSHLRAGDPDEAEAALNGVDELAGQISNVEEHVVHTLREKRIQVKTMREEVEARKTLKVPGVGTIDRRPSLSIPGGAGEELADGEATPVEELSYTPGANAPPAAPIPFTLSAQDILDRAKGVGIEDVTINEAGNVFFADDYQVREGEDHLKAGDEAAELIRETLEAVGLTTQNAVYAGGKVAGRIVEKPPASA